MDCQQSNARGQKTYQRTPRGWRFCKKKERERGDAYVLVVDTVVTRPVVDGALVRDGVDEHHEDADGPVRLVGTVRPQAVYASCDSEPAARSEGTNGDDKRHSYHVGIEVAIWREDRWCP